MGKKKWSRNQRKIGSQQTTKQTYLCAGEKLGEGETDSAVHFQPSWQRILKPKLPAWLWGAGLPELRGRSQSVVAGEVELHSLQLEV